MAETKLFESVDRNEAHQELERVLADGLYPDACCREDPNAPKPYQVWSESPARYVKPPDPAPASVEAEDAKLDVLIDKLLERMAEREIK